ncbi:MAG: ORF6N domain-containing protein [bacterium]
MVKEKENSVIPIESIELKIFSFRNQRVMIDYDLAQLYGVTTKRLNEQVKRNIDRFPQDFMFKINKKEKDELVANCDHFGMLKFSSSLPYAFTEHGTIMLASVLNSDIAVKASIQIVRAFVKLRVIAFTQKIWLIKLNSLKKSTIHNLKLFSKLSNS